MRQREDDLAHFRRHHIGRVLARAYWSFQEQFEAGIRARGFEDYRPSDAEIIARLRVDEHTRVTDLAERARISKQAIGKLVKGLEERGYIERTPDPEDGRAQRIVLSERGVAMLDAAREVVGELEARWAAALPPGALEVLRAGLLELSDAVSGPDYL